MISTRPKPYTRKVSFNERFYLVADALCPPLVMHLFLEGTGVLEKRAWQEAVERASAANPGSRLILRGHLGSCRWVDSGKTPPVREIDGSKWDGLGPVGAPFLQEPLSPTKGPTCEVLLIHGDPLRVAFRVHHGVMDGRGILTWVEDIFRALNDLPAIGSDSILTDTELARSFQRRFRKAFPTEHIAPTGRAEGEEPRVTWLRKRIHGRYPNLLAQAAIQVAKEARRHSKGVVRLGISVDMRPRKESLRSTANLTFAIFIEITPESTPEQLAEEIALKMEQREEGMLSRGDDLYRYIPLWLMRYMGRQIITERHKKGIYSISGLISNMGRIPIEHLAGAGFQSSAIWGIPPSIDYIPFFMVMFGYGENVELIVAMPYPLASGGRLDKAMERIVAGLVPSG